MPITPFSVVPSRQTPATFADDTDTFLSELARFPAEANALEENVNTKEASAVAAAEIAVANATAASALVGAVKWISGTTYAVGDPVWSPATLYTYRRKIEGAGTTDPSLDPVNWSAVSGGGGSNAKSYFFGGM